MFRDLTVRSLDGTRILGDFTPPAGASLAVEECLAGLAHDRATECMPCVIWSRYEPATIYRPEESHAPIQST